MRGGGGGGGGGGAGGVGGGGELRGVSFGLRPFLIGGCVFG